MSFWVSAETRLTISPTVHVLLAELLMTNDYAKKCKRHLTSFFKHYSCFMFFSLSLLGVNVSTCSCSNIGYVMSGGLAPLSHPPSCKLGPWRQSLLSFPPWSTCTCTGGWRGTADRTVGTSRWHRSSPSTGAHPHPSWNPGGGWSKEKNN